MNLNIINIDDNKNVSSIEVEASVTLDQLRTRINLDKFQFIDSDGIEINQNFESNFKVSDLLVDNSDIIYIKLLQQQLYQFSKDIFSGYESQKKQIEALQQQLYESHTKLKNMEDEMNKMKRLSGDQDAKKQQEVSQIHNLQLNQEYQQEDEYRLSSPSLLSLKFASDKDYFKYLLLQPQNEAENQQQKADNNKSQQSKYINFKKENSLNNSNRQIVERKENNGDNRVLLIEPAAAPQEEQKRVEEEEEQKQRKNKELVRLLYPAKKVKELSFEEQQKRKVEHQVNTIRPRVESNLSRLEQAMREMTIVLKNKDKINMNENHHFTATVEVITKVNTEHSNTICLSCNRTCHEVCSYSSDKQECIAILEDYCTVCPQKCFWNQHINTNYKLEYKLISKVVTFDDLRKQYCQTQSDNLQSDEILSGMMKNFLNLKKKIFDDILNLQLAINRLGELLKRPNNITPFDILENMILHEQLTKKIGFQSRIRGLEDIKQLFKNINGLEGQMREDAIEDKFYNHKQAVIDLKLNNLNHFLF